jgi:hypothetical protein
MTVSSTVVADPTPTDRNNASAMKEQTYTVLYYKRKNKVHKSKNVSKMDGTLTFLPPPKSMAVMKEADGNNVVFQGPVTAELATKGCFIDIIDETISLGAYEVEILAKTGNSAAAVHVAMAPKPNFHNPVSSQPSGGPLRNASGAGLHRGLNHVSTNIHHSRSTNSVAKKRSFLDRKPPPQPKKVKMTPDNEEGEDEHAAPTNPHNNTQTTTSAVSSVPLTKSLPSFRRPLKTTVATRTVMLSPPPAGRPQTSSAALGFAASGSTTTTSTTSMTFTTKGEVFAGAVANRVVPHCIKKVLRPHQVEGVTFLWNCLTGNGKVAEVSPHCLPQEDGESHPKTYRGCILGDGENDLPTRRCSQLTMSLYLIHVSLLFASQPWAWGRAS